MASISERFLMEPCFSDIHLLLVPINSISDKMNPRSLLFLVCLLPAVNHAQEFELARNDYRAKRSQLDNNRVVQREILLNRYAQMVDANLKQFQSDGNLEAALAAKAEVDRAKAGQFKAAPAGGDKFPAGLTKVNAIAKTEVEKIETKYQAQIQTLASGYVVTLEALKVRFVQSGRLDDAKEVDAELKSIAKIAGQPGTAPASVNTKPDLPSTLARDLTAWFPLDEKQDATEILDVSSKGLKARPEGTTYVADGVKNGARSFNGDRDRIALVNPLPDSEEFTISMWVKYDGAEHSGGLFSDFDGRGGNDLMFALRGEKQIHVRADKTPDGSLAALVDVRGGVKAGEWIHLVWAMDKRGSSVYANGKRIARVEGPGRNIGCHRAYIGFSNNTSNWSYFKGQIDEVMIWSRALSGSQVDEVLGLYER